MPDPRAQMLAQLRSSSGALSSAASFPIPNDDDMPPGPPIPSSNLISPPSGIPLTTFGALVKRQVKLADKSSVAFDQFCQNPSPDERSVILFAHVLELLDISRKNEKAEHWVITPELSKKIAGHMQVFTYSPDLTAYRGLAVASHVMDLPTEDETTQCELVVSKIREKGTHYRNILKTAVKTALDPNHETANVAVLANKLLSGTKIKATLQFYMRLAFIRFVMRSYEWLTEETFWLKVDLAIEENSRDCATKDELDAFYNMIYQDDIAIYGDPANTSTPKLVKPNPKNAQVLAPAEKAFYSGRSLKRARVEMENEDAGGTEGNTGGDGGDDNNA
ncbi:hypothetical protein B0H14DRAFT_3467278 [Mycena olivaceomarginata]|nr:hypothetical protein B0H14DRAFT_3467278 [Mycena olivaceomarginata]